MTDKEKSAIEEMFQRYRHACFICGKPATQRAHCIGNTKANRSRYGNDVIDNPLNWLPACSLKCNALIDVGHSNIFTDYIAHLIEKGSRMGIEQAIRDNVARKQNK